MRKPLFALLIVTLSAIILMTACDPEDVMSDFPTAQYMDQAFSIFVTDDSFDNFCGSHLVLDFNGDGGYDNGVVPTYLTEFPTVDGYLEVDEPWHPDQGICTWYTVDLEHKPYASGYDDPDDAFSSEVVDEVDVCAAYTVSGGVGILYMAFQWTDPSGTDDHYHKRWRFYGDVRTVLDIWEGELRQVENGLDPRYDDFPEYYNDPDCPVPDGYNHGFSSDTLGLVWDIWGVEDPEADNPMPTPSVEGFFDGGWDICWYQDGNDWLCKLTPDMATYENTAKLDIWWWSAAKSNWQPREIQDWAYMEDMYQTSEDLTNDHGPIPDQGFPPFRYNWQQVKFGPRFTEHPLFHHQDQPAYIYYPESPEWIYMDYIDWSDQGREKFGPSFSDREWHMGDEIPGYGALSSTLGSAGDVIARGTFDEDTGVWTLEVERYFYTDWSDDADLNQYYHGN